MERWKTMRREVMQLAFSASVSFQLFVSATRRKVASGGFTDSDWPTVVKATHSSDTLLRHASLRRYGSVSAVCSDTKNPFRTTRVMVRPYSTTKISSNIQIHICRVAIMDAHKNNLSTTASNLAATATAAAIIHSSDDTILTRPNPNPFLDPTP
mmetsp:Transcript_10373/g.29596  ORF Transcript_10373/g.29596 Transcript_10373/m.29596 type:complete len:154 (+) Transcript_10373:4241-4702(+)